MTDHSFSFQGAQLCARHDGTLWWPDKALLCVSDLHLGKSERIARRGGTLLPPYETRETLSRLQDAINATNPATVVCLGDSFDDLGAAKAVDDDTRATLAGMQTGRRWLWIEGNHDPGPVDLGGEHVFEAQESPLTFRHIAMPRETGEVSGHYHPKAAIAGAGRRPCFLIDRARIIMPAFGAYTGGLCARDAAFADLMQGDAVAVLTGKRATPVPLRACLKR